ncbi:hypothetical protein ABPG75_007019 [Micractinium tetrahymenae]
MPIAALGIGGCIGYGLGFALAVLLVFLCPCTAFSRARRAAWAAARSSSPAATATATSGAPEVQLPSAKVTSEDCKPATTGDFHSVDLEAAAPTAAPAQLVIGARAAVSRRPAAAGSL